MLRKQEEWIPLRGVPYLITNDQPDAALLQHLSVQPEGLIGDDQDG